MESELHKKLKNRAVEYLYNKSCWIVRPEVDCGYYGRYDAWGIKSDLNTYGIEVKVSKADFKNNQLKEHKLEYIGNDGNKIESYIPANYNYILCPAGMLMPDEIHPLYGLLWFTEKRLINKKKPVFIEMTNKKKLQIVMRFLSSKQNNNVL